MKGLPLPSGSFEEKSKTVAARACRRLALCARATRGPLCIARDIYGDVLDTLSAFIAIRERSAKIGILQREKFLEAALLYGARVVRS